MPDPSVDLLRQQLRDRGYLSHGIERWFALDPWSSRTFWLELAIVALKAALVVALFGILPPTAVMLFRLFVIMFQGYVWAAWFLMGAIFVAAGWLAWAKRNP